MEHDVQRAVAARNHGFRRVRVFTGAAVVAGVAFTAVLTALAGASTHLKKAIVRRPAATSASTTTAKVTAPAPPIVEVHTQPTTQAPPAASQAPVQTSAPPVVVSGGS